MSTDNSETVHVPARGGNPGEPRASCVRRLLEAFRPADARERQHLDAMLALLGGTPAPLARDQFEPGHFTASAFVVSRARGAALLIDHPTLHRWLQPGGHIEPGDADPLAGARREVLEETGLHAVDFREGLFDIDVHAIPARGAAPSHLHFDLRFLGIVEGLPAPAGVEGVSAQWVPLAELTGHTGDDSVCRMGRKALALLP